MEYTQATDEHRKQYLLERLHHLEMEHYGHAMIVKSTVTDNMDGAREQAQAKQALETIERIIAVVKEELRTYDDSTA